MLTQDKIQTFRQGLQETNTIMIKEPICQEDTDFQMFMQLTAEPQNPRSKMTGLTGETGNSTITVGEFSDSISVVLQNNQKENL